MPRLTIAVDITANASTPGTEKVDWIAARGIDAVHLGEEDEDPRGISIVTTRLHRDGRSAAARGELGRPPLALSSLPLAGEVKEDVFERAASALSSFTSTSSSASHAVERAISIGVAGASTR